MDRSLDETISERQRSNYRGRRGRNDWPRDGVRKSSQRDESRNLDRDWVHDRFEEIDDARRRPRNTRYRSERNERRPYSPDRDNAPRGVKLRVEGLHYEITEDELWELFGRFGEVLTAHLVYDRQDRSTGVAFVTYGDAGDASRAVKETDGALAYGQRITVNPVSASTPRPNRSFQGEARPSLFERIGDRDGRDGRDGRNDRNDRNGGVTRGRISRDRSASPEGVVRHSDVSKPPPEHIDRYVPGQDTRRRSPLPRRGNIRRPGARREVVRRGDQRDTEGRLIVQGRPRKTAEELDAEMEDYWSKRDEDSGLNTAQNGASGPTATATDPLALTADDNNDIDMIE